MMIIVIALLIFWSHLMFLQCWSELVVDSVQDHIEDVRDNADDGDEEDDDDDLLINPFEPGGILAP